MPTRSHRKFRSTYDRRDLMTQQETNEASERQEFVESVELLLPRYTRADAPQYLLRHHGIKISTATLAKYATVGGGPKFQKFGRRVYYPAYELSRWAQQRIGALQDHTSTIHQR